MAKVWAEITLRDDKLNQIIANLPFLGMAIAATASAIAVNTAKTHSRVRTGAMRKGWTRRPIGVGHAGGYRIYNTVPYTVHHEYGTRSIPPQPMLGPGMAAARRALGPIMRLHLQQSAVRAIGKDGSVFVIE